MDQTLFTKATETLLGSGPLALVLLVAIIVLWRENKSLQERLLKILEGIAGDKK